METIYGAIAGRPKKEVLAMIEWLAVKEQEHEADPEREVERGPFDAATLLKGWRKNRERKGESADEQGSAPIP